MLAQQAPSKVPQSKPKHHCHLGRRHRLLEYWRLPSGMMAGRTPNLDKMAHEGMMFTDYYAEASCTAGRAASITAGISPGDEVVTVIAL